MSGSNDRKLEISHQMLVQAYLLKKLRLCVLGCEATLLNFLWYGDKLRTTAQPLIVYTELTGHERELRQYQARVDYALVFKNQEKQDEGTRLRRPAGHLVQWI